MSSIAYGLRAEYADGFLGGVINVGGRDLDMAEELARGKGRIVVADHDHTAIHVLDSQPALKRVAAEGAEPTVSYWANHTVTQLHEELTLRDLPRTGTKAELVERLEAHAAALAAGEDPSAAGAGDHDNGEA